MLRWEWRGVAERLKRPNRKLVFRSISYLFMQVMLLQGRGIRERVQWCITRTIVGGVARGFIGRPEERLNRVEQKRRVLSIHKLQEVKQWRAQVLRITQDGAHGHNKRTELRG